MNLQARKLNLIDFLLRLQDESIIKKIEGILTSSKKTTDLILKPFTEEEFYARNERSQKDIREGKLVSHKEVKARFSVK